ncbi:MAG: helix-turn-helix transcriptional regulator [Anaerolineae bacterium]|nr:helix-turn-helix transcriptional regulator [Anaerolineae bacterium]
MLPTSKYYPLFEYLKQQPDSGLLELSLAEIEEILGQKLPVSAQASRAWWANSATTQGRAWQEAGWLIDLPDLENKVIVFRPARITYRVSPIRKSVGWTGDQIKALREFAGWSQQELADRLAVRQQTISDWEVGNHTARRSMSKLLQMIAREIGFPYKTEPPEANESEKSG